jgi:UDP-N-acetylmuramate dehydrogenase
VTYIDGQGRIGTQPASQCDFRYRHSWFQKHTAVIVEVSLRLAPGVRDDLMRDMLEILRCRRANFPLRQPNCGSVFKNSDRLYTVAGPPGRAIESMGFKGRRVGDAQVSHRHANFITNQGRATSRDTLALMQCIMARAHEKLACALEAEVLYVDVHGRVRPAHEAVPV